MPIIPGTFNRSWTLAVLKGDADKPDRACCFLCGADVTGSKNRPEHVVPDWLQKHFGVRDREYVLPKQRGGKYRLRSLRSPCCYDCNYVHLRPIEDEVAVALKAGPTAFAALDPVVQHIWLAKVWLSWLYAWGAMFRRRIDRNDRGLVQVPWGEYRGARAILYAMSRGAADLSHADPAIPASIFTWRIRRGAEFPGAVFWPPSTLGIACLIGETGVVACLGDWGLMKRTCGLILHGLPRQQNEAQFFEVAARLLYKQSLHAQIKSEAVIGDSHLTVIPEEARRYSDWTFFKPWDHRKFLDHSQGHLPFGRGLRSVHLLQPDGSVKNERVSPTEYLVSSFPPRYHFVLRALADI